MDFSDTPIVRLIPQRHPMIMVDKMLNCDDIDAVAVFTIRQDNILLDDDQRRVVLTDEDYCLVVAGAGAGKTTTVAAKVKYLVDKQGIDPKQILVISFTNNVYTARFERSARSF